VIREDDIVKFIFSTNLRISPKATGRDLIVYVTPCFLHNDRTSGATL